MRRIPFVATLVFILCSCKEKSNTPVDAGLTDSKNASERVLYLSHSSDNVGDPSTDQWIQQWLEELVKPRVQSLSGVTGVCSTRDKNAVLISLKDLNVSCSQLLEANPNPFGMQIDCIADDRMRVVISNLVCESEHSLDVALKRLRLPEGKGFYLRADNKGRLVPNVEFLHSLAGTLYPIEFKPAGDTKLKFRAPTHNEWLQANSADGLMSLELIFEAKSGLNDVQKLPLLHHLRSYLQGVKAAKLFSLRAQVLGPVGISVTPPAVDRRIPGLFYIVNEAPGHDLNAQVCNYLRSWIHAEQVLDKMRRGGRVVSLDCRLRMSVDEITDPLLSVTQLPLPLVSVENASFPIKTFEESRSMTVLQGMMR